MAGNAPHHGPPAIDQGMFLYRFRDDARAQFGVKTVKTVSVCWRSLFPDLSLKGYQIVWEFLLRIAGNSIYSNQGRSMASIALDMVSGDNPPLYNSIIPDVNTIYAGLIGRPPVEAVPAGGGPNPAPAVAAIPGVCNPLWARFVLALASVPDDRDPQQIADLRVVIDQWNNPPTYDDVANSCDHFLNAMTAVGPTIVALHKAITNHRADTMFLSSVLSICYRGTMTERAINKMCNGFDASFEMRDVLTPENVRVCYQILRALFEPDRDVGVFFKTLETEYDRDTHLRMNLTVTQTRSAGAAALMITLAAIRQSRTCPAWGYLLRNAPAEWQNFKAAHAILMANPYAGFDLGRNPPEELRPTLYPSLTYCGLAILRALDPNDTSIHYRGVQQSPHKAGINTMVSRWLTERAAAMA